MERDFEEGIHRNECRCCRRSKSQGTFFELHRQTWAPSRHEWNWAGRTGLLQEFESAASQQCRRCKVVNEVILAYKSGHSENTTTHVFVYNKENFLSGNLVARVHFSLGEGSLFEDSLELRELGK